MSHTSSLAGPDVLYQALFKRFGVARVCGCWLAAGDAASFACAWRPGGQAHGVGQLLGRGSLAGGRPGACTGPGPCRHCPKPRGCACKTCWARRSIVANPLDYHTYIWGDAAASTEAFSGLMDCGFDAHVLVLDFPRADRCDGSSWRTTLDAFIAAKEAAPPGTVACVVATLPEGMPDPVAAALLAHGLAPMQGTLDCLCAIGHAAAFGHALRTVGSNAALPGPADRSKAGLEPPPHAELKHPPHADASAVLGPAPRLLNEVRSKAQLHMGVPVPRGGMCNAAQAPAMAQHIGMPVVVKAVADTLAHKTELGGVQLNLRSTEAVAQAVASMAHLSDQFLVERMEAGAVAGNHCGHPARSAVWAGPYRGRRRHLGRTAPRQRHPALSRAPQRRARAAWVAKNASAVGGLSRATRGRCRGAGGRGDGHCSVRRGARQHPARTSTSTRCWFCQKATASGSWTHSFATSRQEHHVDAGVALHHPQRRRFDHHAQTRPEANAINVATSKALYAAFKTLQDDAALRVGIITERAGFFRQAGICRSAVEARAIGCCRPRPGWVCRTDGVFWPAQARDCCGQWPGHWRRLRACAVCRPAGCLRGRAVCAARGQGSAWSLTRAACCACHGGFPGHWPPKLLLTGRRMNATEAAHWGLVNTISAPETS